MDDVIFDLRRKGECVNCVLLVDSNFYLIQNSWDSSRRVIINWLWKIRQQIQNKNLPILLRVYLYGNINYLSRQEKYSPYFVGEFRERIIGCWLEWNLVASHTSLLPLHIFVQASHMLERTQVNQNSEATTADSSANMLKKQDATEIIRDY